MKRLWTFLFMCVAVTLSAQEQTRWIKPNAFTDSTGLRQIGLMSDGRAGLNDQMSLYGASPDDVPRPDGGTASDVVRAPRPGTGDVPQTLGAHTTHDVGADHR